MTTTLRTSDACRFADVQVRSRRRDLDVILVDQAALLEQAKELVDPRGLVVDPRLEAVECC
jgi:hypothetical protein